MRRTEITAQTSSNSWKRLLPGLLISIISLAVVFYFAKPRELYKALRLADLRLILAALGFMLVWLVVRTLAWRTLLQKKASFTQVFFTVNEGYLLNNVLPFRLGEIARGFLLSHKARLRFWEVFPTILIERALDLALAAGLLLATLPFIIGTSWARQAALVSGGIVLIGLLALYVLARYRAWAIRQFDRLAQKWPTLGKHGGRSLVAFLDGLAVITIGRVFSLAIFYLVLDWSIALVQYYFVVRAFLPQAPFLWAAFTLGIAAIGVAAPSSPGSVGVYELAVTGALILLGNNPAISLAIALSGHLIQYLTVGILGAIGLARDGESLIGIYSRARRFSQQDSLEVVDPVEQVISDIPTPATDYDPDPKA